MAGRTPARTRGALGRRAKESYVTHRVFLPAQNFIHRAGVSGVALVVASIIAMAWANVSYDSYHHFWETRVAIAIGSWELNKTFHHIVNDGLMAIFFFVVGLEIKRELIRGDLSTPRRAMMPVAAAIGGMVGPAFLYAAFNWGTPEIGGWGVPMATDIAFALGVLALLGDRVPSELRVLLLGLAIVDDIGSILVIAVFYTESLQFTALTVSAALAIAIVLMRRLGFSTAAAYVVIGMLFWLAVWESGVHATLAGVVLGAMTALRPTYTQAQYDAASQELHARYREALRAGDTERAEATLGGIEELVRGTESPLERAERMVHPWVTALVLPVFALANAGIPLSVELVAAAFSSPVALGIIFGLVFGKFFGILGFCWIAVKLGIGVLPGRATWTQIAGVAALGGIGFTVSLFIAALAFADPRVLDEAKVGVLAASLVAGLVGFLLLRLVSRPTEERQLARA